MILEECPRCSGEEKSCMQLMYIGAMSPLSDLVLKLCAVQYATNFGVNILCGDTTHTDDSSNLVTLYMAQMHLQTIRSSSSPVQQERAQPASMR